VEYGQSGSNSDIQLLDLCKKMLLNNKKILARAHTIDLVSQSTLDNLMNSTQFRAQTTTHYYYYTNNNQFQSTYTWVNNVTNSKYTLIDYASRPSTYSNYNYYAHPFSYIDYTNTWSILDVKVMFKYNNTVAFHDNNLAILRAYAFNPEYASRLEWHQNYLQQLFQTEKISSVEFNLALLEYTTIKDEILNKPDFSLL
jgi:hypothetical protein